MDEGQSSDSGSKDIENQAQETPRVVLQAAITLGDVNALHEELVMVVARGRGLCVDGSMVERMTTPGIQLLLVVMRHLRAQGDTAIIETPSAQLIAAFEDLGLGSEFETWRTAT